jgi:hypothetical protein
MYSQIGQDEWVLSLFKQGYMGFFMDIGCYEPTLLSNTLLLEQNGWSGIAFDINDFSVKWRSRKTKFVQVDVTKCNFQDYNLPEIVDYLSLDVDSLGDNYMVMKKLIDAKFIFKSVTIEHNLYIGDEYNEKERIPQRVLLSTAGYKLIFPDVMFGGKNKFEDWWINPKYL